MSMELFDLPTEILLRTLCFLDISELALLSQTHSKFHVVIQNSQGLQFRLLATKAYVESNTHSNHAAYERVALLRDREEGWSSLSFDFNKTIPGVPFPSEIFALTGGFYFRGDQSGRSIHYCKLPSNPDETAIWKRIDIDSDKTLLEIGVSVYENNLIAIATLTSHPTITSHVIEISLLELTTGRSHPLAKNPVLFVEETSSWAPVMIEIVGDYLALVMAYPPEGEMWDIIRVWNWKRDIIKMNIQTLPDGTYHDIIFLSPTLILLPNIDNTLDIWEIPSDAALAPTHPLLCLSLPPVNQMGWSIHSISCRAEPNLMPNGSSYSQAPFHASPEDALVVFHVSMSGPGHQPLSSYSLFVRRSALLAQCTTPLCNPGDWAQDGERVRAWNKWGPPISRVLPAEDIYPPWITITAGQRAIVASEEANDWINLRILDFSSSAVQRAIEEVQTENGELAYSILLTGASEESIPGLVNEVASHLPFVGFDVPLNVTEQFRKAMMDEERILVMLANDDHSEEINVWHIGMPPNDKH